MYANNLKYVFLWVCSIPICLKVFVWLFKSFYLIEEVQSLHKNKQQRLCVHSILLF